MLFRSSMSRDGIACNAQTCGNVVLQQHIAQELQRSGDRAQAARVESALRQAVTKVAEVVSKKEPPHMARVIEWRTLRNYAISLTRRWPVAWNLKSVPWAVWIGCLCGYAIAVGLLLHRTRSADAISLR